MDSDGIEAAYYTARLQTSLDMAAQAVNVGAMMAHEGLAACYRAKLASLVEPPRAVLSLASFRGKKQAAAFQCDRPSPSVGVLVATR